MICHTVSLTSLIQQSLFPELVNITNLITSFIIDGDEDVDDGDVAEEEEEEDDEAEVDGVDDGGDGDEVVVDVDDLLERREMLCMMAKYEHSTND